MNQEADRIEPGNDSSANIPWVPSEDLSKIALLRSVDPKAVEPLLRYCEIKQLEPGDILIHAGAPNRYLYLLLSGRLSVHMEAPDKDPIAFIEPGESVGEISLIDNHPTSACVCAIQPSRMMVIDEQLMWMLVNTSHAISTNLLFTLALRLRSGNESLAESREQTDKFRFRATVDGLTGLYNRHWLDQMLVRQLHFSRQNAETLSLLMLDIDHFKNYNDMYGHPAGDRALRAVSETIKARLRPADMAARYGGEEFVVLLPSTDRNTARSVGERLREAVSATIIHCDRGDPLPRVTASIGVTEMADHCTPGELMKEADKALYEAKRSGRNRVAG